MENIEVILALLGAMSVLVALARRLAVPYPILLVVGGLLISLIPGLPRVELAPDLVFLLFLPPIITSAGFYTPIRDFRFDLRPILLLAVGCVLFTMAVIAVVAHAVVPELPWAAAFALGAIVAPPDAIAATSIAQRLNLPRRIVTILEGESLVNDASALVAYRVAVGAVGGAFSLTLAGVDFVVANVGGALVGLAVGWLVSRLLALLDDSPIEVILTFLGSFATYIVAETLHVSGVLATVALGLYVGRQSARVMSPTTRVQAEAVWQVVIFLLNGLVFILIGLQLPTVIAGLGQESYGTLAWYALAICGALIISRFVWMFPGTYLPRYLSAALRGRDPAPPWQFPVILSWAGMRGIVSLATALALPEGFPQRDLILFLTFCVILVTLVAQGLSLPWLIRTLKVTDDGQAEAHEEAKARLVAAKAALRRLDELGAEEWVEADHIEHLREHHIARRDHFHAQFSGTLHPSAAPRTRAYMRLEREVIDAELEALIRLRDSDHINDEVLRRIQRELDFERLQLGRG